MIDQMSIYQLSDIGRDPLLRELRQVKKEQVIAAIWRESAASVLNVMNPRLSGYQFPRQDGFSPSQIIREYPTVLSIQQREIAYASDRVDQPRGGIDHTAILQGIHDPAISRPAVLIDPNEPLIHVDKGKKIDRLFEAIEKRPKSWMPVNIVMRSRKLEYRYCAFEAIVHFQRRRVGRSVIGDNKVFWPHN
jgi:hypothetical protein